jgi:2-dehydropantoate 2-reductase
MAGMRILVVGAGAIGGYFGGRLLAAGRDVTFLVRPGRLAALARTGLVIKGGSGDVTLPGPPVVTAEEVAGREPYDLVVLSCKAYDLESAIDGFAPAVGRDTAIIPLLNGMRHLDTLDKRFDARAVLGGYCLISSKLDTGGRILHLNDTHLLSYGERDTGLVPGRMAAITEVLDGAGFDVAPSADIVRGMWEKWLFISTGAAITCLMRAMIGDIVEAGGSSLTVGMLHEAAAVATAAGFPPSAESVERTRSTFTLAGSPLSASMLRDIELGSRTEADHLLGDLLDRADRLGVEAPLLRIAHTHLKAYETRRTRELTETAEVEA